VTKVVPLVNADIWTIGRDPSNSVIIRDKSISRNHATIQILGDTPENESFFLVDLGSRNGSFIEQQRVSFPLQLKNGDRIVLGKVRINFYLPSSQPFIEELHPKANDNIQSGGSQAALTQSEEKIFWQVVQGFSDQEIIKRLQVSQRVLQANLKNILQKLKLQDRADIEKFALEHSQEVSESTEIW
jgi:pSer/pThr/pTyr-binding forkhead associated (FHA) protein